MEYQFLGRQKIFSSIEDLTADNVLLYVIQALETHMFNQAEEDYLYWYRKGRQPILKREKDVRPEICNKVVINNADQVVQFKNGYFLTKPAFYKTRKENEAKDDISAKVSQLNEYIYLSGKPEVDNDVVNWFHTVGVGVIYLEPNRNNNEREQIPVKVYSLDPRTAFVVYSMYPGNEPLFCVHYVKSGNKTIYDVYTRTKKFTLSGASVSQPEVVPEAFKNCDLFLPTSILSIEDNLLGYVPMVEYVYNSNRMSAFENALSLMDEINNVESNRCDGIEQSIQQLMVAYNCAFEEGTTANQIMKAGMILLKSTNENKADVKMIEASLDQTATQTTLDSLYEQMLEKCGVPSSVRDAGSTSDNVGAVYLRSGWAAADTACRNTEDEFKKSNKYFDKVFLKILKDTMQFEIGYADYELVFPRTDMSNLLVKVQAAKGMKDLGFAPEIAFERSGLSNDPLNDIELSKKYIESIWGSQEYDNTDVEVRTGGIEL